MNSLTFVFIILATRVIFEIITRKTESSKVLKKSGWKVLELSNIYRILGEIAFFMTFILIIGLNLDFFYFHWDKTLTSVLWPNICSSFLCMPFLYLILIGKNYRVIFNDETIIFTGMFGKKHVMKWSEIEKIEFSKRTFQFYLYSKNTKIPVANQLIGIKHFIETVKAKFPEKMYEKALADREKSREIEKLISS